MLGRAECTFSAKKGVNRYLETREAECNKDLKCSIISILSLRPLPPDYILERPYNYVELYD